MSELLLPPPPPPLPRGTSFGDPASVFPEFAGKQCFLEKVLEGEREGEDSSCGKRSCDLSSRGFSSPSVSRNEHDDVETPRKTPLKLPLSEEEEEIDQSRNSSQEENRRYSECFRKCCAWTCMLVSIVLIIVLLIGLSVNSSITSKLPHVIVTNLKFSRLDFDKSSNDLLMNANLHTVLQLTNKNDKTVLSYSPMKADVSSENINLGYKTILGFKQKPGNVTSLKISTRLKKSKVYDVDATLLKNKEKKLEAVINVFLRGKLSFDWLGFMIHMPIVIACNDVKQSDAVNGLKPTCDVQIFSK